MVSDRLRGSSATSAELSSSSGAVFNVIVNIANALLVILPRSVVVVVLLVLLLVLGVVPPVPRPVGGPHLARGVQHHQHLLDGAGAGHGVGPEVVVLRLLARAQPLLGDELVGELRHAVGAVVDAVLPPAPLPLHHLPQQRGGQRGLA